MRVIFAFCLVCFFFSLPFVLYRFLYFKKVTFIYVSFYNRISYLDSVLPTRRTFKKFFNGRPYSCVSLGNGFFAFYVSKPGADEPCSPVYVFQRSRYGRFCSIDVAKCPFLKVV